MQRTVYLLTEYLSGMLADKKCNVLSSHLNCSPRPPSNWLGNESAVVGSRQHCQAPWLENSGGKHPAWGSGSWRVSLLGSLWYCWSMRLEDSFKKKKKKIPPPVPLHILNILGLFWGGGGLLYMRLLLVHWCHKTSSISYGTLYIHNKIMNLIFVEKLLFLKYPGLLSIWQPQLHPWPGIGNSPSNWVICWASCSMWVVWYPWIWEHPGIEEEQSMTE